jgi:hypothetical protein
VLSEAELQADLRQRGLIRVQKFSWQKAVDELEQVYRLLSSSTMSGGRRRIASSRN